MSNADTRSDWSIDSERPSVDAPLAPNEWAEYRCRRCGEHCINRADGEPRGTRLCLDCFAARRADDEPVVGSVADPDTGGDDDPTPASPFRSVRSSLATVAARFGGD